MTSNAGYQKTISLDVTGEDIFAFSAKENMTTNLNISASVYKEIAESIGTLVGEKNEAYGDSFGRASEILEVLYPTGIKPGQYRDALAITRVIDKLFRLATKKDAFGESPWRDICGYAILGVANDEIRPETKACDK